jgi:hypothetical protein
LFILRVFWEHTDPDTCRYATFFIHEGYRFNNGGEYFIGYGFY